MRRRGVPRDCIIGDQAMHIGAAYADKFKRAWLKLDVPENSTVQEVVEPSGLLKQFPDIDLTRQRVGVFGRLKKREAIIAEGDRVEIYRDIRADPNLSTFFGLLAVIFPKSILKTERAAVRAMTDGIRYA